jgi:hypothetical protein
MNWTTRSAVYREVSRDKKGQDETNSRDWFIDIQPRVYRVCDGRIEVNEQKSL